MKKLALNLAVCVGVCAVLGAVCLFGACGHEASDDDAATFVEGITNTNAYDGSFTIEISTTTGGSVSVSGESDGGEETTTRKVTYDASSGSVAIKNTAYGTESCTYYVKDDEGNLLGYTQSGDTKSAISKPSENTYNSYTTLSGVLGMANLSSDSTLDNVKRYMLNAVSSSVVGNYKDADLKISGSTFTLTYEENDDGYTSSVEVVFKFGSKGLTEVTYSEEIGAGAGGFSIGTSNSGSIKITYSYTSSMMPKNFDDFE